MVRRRPPKHTLGVLRTRIAPLGLLVAVGCFNPGPPIAGQTGASTGASSTADDAPTGSASGSSTAALDSSGSDSGDLPAPDCESDVDCDDTNPCTDDACEPDGCAHELRVDDPACSCVDASDCTQLPEDDACGVRACDDGTCARVLTANATPLPPSAQTVEDCRVFVCDGLGGVRDEIDDLDVPADGNTCTVDECEAGFPTNTPVESGVPCEAGTCDGAGNCFGCTTPDECGPALGFCSARTCDDSICGQEFTPSGTLLPAGAQVGQDCAQLECDGSGNEVAVVDDSDVPVSDGNPCTVAACIGGAEVHPPQPAGTTCPTGVCDGAGGCVECTAAAHCSSVDPCNPAACVANVCTTEFAVAGTVCDDQQFCTATDTCNATGICVGVGDPCPGADGDGDCSESCNEATDSCTGNDLNGTICGPCSLCTQGNCISFCEPGLEVCCDGLEQCLPVEVC